MGDNQLWVNKNKSYVDQPDHILYNLLNLSQENLSDVMLLWRLLNTDQKKTRGPQEPVTLTWFSI